MIPEATIFALTLFCEARGEPLAGKLAVASVIVNRSVPNKVCVRDVCLRPYQFSCWNGYAKKHKILRLYQHGHISGSAWDDCKKVVGMWLDNTLPKTQFTHYYNPKLAKPSWAGKLTGKKRIGNHIFGRIER